MALCNITQLLLIEADIQLAISSIDDQQIHGNCPAAAIYSVADATLRPADALECLPDAIASPFKEVY